MQFHDESFSSKSWFKFYHSLPLPVVCPEGSCDRQSNWRRRQSESLRSIIELIRHSNAYWRSVRVVWGLSAQNSGFFFVMFSKSSAKQGRAEDAMFITSPNLPLQNSDARSGHEFHLLFWVDLWLILRKSQVTRGFHETKLYSRARSASEYSRRVIRGTFDF